MQFKRVKPGDKIPLIIPSKIWNPRKTSRKRARGKQRTTEKSTSASVVFGAHRFHPSKSQIARNGHIPETTIYPIIITEDLRGRTIVCVPQRIPAENFDTNMEHEHRHQIITGNPGVYEAYVFIAEGVGKKREGVNKGGVNKGKSSNGGDPAVVPGFLCVVLHVDRRSLAFGCLAIQVNRAPSAPLRSAPTLTYGRDQLVQSDKGVRREDSQKKPRLIIDYWFLFSPSFLVISLSALLSLSLLSLFSLCVCGSLCLIYLSLCLSCVCSFSHSLCQLWLCVSVCVCVCRCCVCVCVCV